VHLSDISDDKKVINEGRRDPLKDVDADLRDQVVKKLFNKCEELDLGIKCSKLWAAGNSNRTLWLERQKEYLSQWDEHLVSETNGSFKGSSQLHVPITFIVVKALQARYLQAIWQDPPFTVRAENEASIERIPTVKDTMRYYLVKAANKNKGVGKVVDQWVWKWVAAGSAVLKERWECLYTRFVDVRNIKKPGAPIFDPHTGQLVQTQVDAQEEVNVTKKVFEGPIFENVPLEDLLIIGGGGDPDEADSVHHRQWLTASELWTLADRKIFDNDAVHDIIESGPDSVEGALGTDIKTQQANNAGQASKDTGTDLDRYEILESYLKVDIDGSGINSDIIVWSHARTGKLCRATYLYRVSKTGERPFAKADFHLREGQEHGIGIPEIMYPLAKEIDAIHNMRIDFGLISVMPFGFYRASSGIDPETIQLEPGALIPVDNPQTDVHFPQLGQRTLFGQQEEAALDQMIQRLTGINDLAMGMMQGQGVARTASGVRAAVGEMSANLDVHLRRLNWGWEKALRYLLHMLQQRIPKGLSFRLSGDDGHEYWRTIRDAEDLAGDFDIEVSPNSSTSNSAIQQQRADEIMQMVQNPLAIQMGTVTPAQFFEAQRNWYQSRDVKDWSRFLNKPQGPLRIFTPEEEANRILRGIPVPVTPEMDHQGFLGYWAEIRDNDELLGQFNEAQTIMLAEQAQKHEQMLQALKQMQAQAANAGQMQRNAAMSQQQAPVGMSPMAQGGGMPNANAPT
jgi:hypothetical protein